MPRKNKKEASQYRKEYYLKNKEAILTKNKEYQDKHREELIEKSSIRSKSWYENQDKRSLYQKRKERQIELGRPKWYSTPERCIKPYIKNALNRNLEFNLSLEEFKSFWQKDCHFCSDTINTIGIDRLDNNLGYTLENVVSCCKICNFMKRNLSVEDFLTKCKRITECHS